MVANGRKKFRLFIENVITNGDYIKKVLPGRARHGRLRGRGARRIFDFLGIINIA